MSLPDADKFDLDVVCGESLLELLALLPAEFIRTREELERKMYLLVVVRWK